MGLSSQSKQVYNRLTNFPTITTICRSCLSQAVEVWVFLPTCPLVAKIEFPQYWSNSSSRFPDLNFQSVWSQEAQLIGWCFNPQSWQRSTKDGVTTKFIFIQLAYFKLWFLPSINFKINSKKLVYKALYDGKHTLYGNTPFLNALCILFGFAIDLSIEVKKISSWLRQECPVYV